MTSFLKKLFSTLKSTPPEPPALPVRIPLQNFQLSNFEVLHTLGRGTFGRVRLVRTFETGEFFALKMMKKTAIVKLKQMTHVLNEVKIMSMMSNPFIVSLIGHFQDENRLYLVLSYVRGGELFTLLRAQSAFHQTAAIFYAAELILALKYLHELKVCYRDLKPENVLLEEDGHIKLCDFGLAKIIADRTWTLCGTAEYLAPEMIENVGHGLSVDWWSLGVLVYEMLSGHPPFYGDTPYDTYKQVVEAKVKFERSFPPSAAKFVKQLLTKDRRKRLGCGKGGARDVMNHKWLAGLDWKAIGNKQAQVPFIPQVKSLDDPGNFIEYPDSFEDDAIPL
eukprot:CAMPEP_0118652076 /NCGR_PEP_ID=MMETSP0785-20121206/11123_1 /TAXON_ID=91992 /ORGANISM="Bolidomonas pacifica, Strain CCMP 1866" /LENGTH=334 /DNA_ID=CAMNT_0006544565 /DNA_START=71 /DNA_END=1071 /DNA_ORIENTATION=-